MAWRFDAPYTADQLTAIHSGAYSASYRLTLCKNVVVLHATVTSTDQVGNESWAMLNYTTVSGSYTNVLPDMAVLIGPTSDILEAQSFWRGRIRYDGVAHMGASATALYLNETSVDVPVGYHVFVLNTYDPTYRLSRWDTTNNLEKIDYNWPYQPDPPLDPDLKTAYVGDVDSITGKFTVHFDASRAYASSYGATVASCAWYFAEGTYSGLTATVDFNPGQQWGRQVLTDSHGVSWTRHIFISAHDAANPPDLYFGKLDIRMDNFTSGWTLRAPAYQGVDTVLNDTFAVVWRADERFGGQPSTKFPNNLAFIGWIQREEDSLMPDPANTVLSDAMFEITSIVARMGRLFAQNIPMILNFSPAKWGDIAYLSTHRAIIHFMAYYSTFLNLFSLENDIYHEYLFPTIVTPGDSLWNAVQSMADQIRANVETSFDGRIRVNVDAAQLNDSDRLEPNVIANFTAADIILPGGLKRSIERSKNTGIVDGDGATYNLSNAQVTEFTTRAPGYAMGDGQGRSTIANQILSPYFSISQNGLTDLQQRVGNQLEMVNMSETLTVQFRDAWISLIPSRAQLYTFTLDSTAAGTNGVNRVVYDTTVFWLLESVSYGTEGNGAVKVEGKFRRLPRQGDLGDNTTPVPPTSIPITVPNLVLPPFPDMPLVVPESGLATAPATLPPTSRTTTVSEEHLVHNTTKIFYLNRFISLRTPYSNAVTPSDLGAFEVKDIKVDPFYTTTALPAYALASDGSNSAVWYTEDISLPSPIWTKGDEVTGNYEILRVSNVDGTVLIASGQAPGGPSWRRIFNFRVDQQGWTITPANPGYLSRGFYTAGIGFDGNLTAQNDGDDGILDITSPPALADSTITSIDWFYNRDIVLDGTNFISYVTYGGNLFFNDGPRQFWETLPIAPETVTNFTRSFSGSVAIAKDETWRLALWYYYNGSGHPGHDVGGARMIQATVRGSGTPPYTDCDTFAAVQPSVRVSTNWGAAFGSALNLGANPADLHIGFDVQRNGANSFGAGQYAVYRATTLGGSYTSYYSVTNSANVACIVVPYYTWAGGDNTAATNPDIVIFLTATDGSGRTALWLEGGVASPSAVHDITPVAGITFDATNCGTVHYQHHLACFGRVSGAYHLYTTNNRGATWVDRGVMAYTPSHIRCRRRDQTGPTSGTNLGQLYLVVSDRNATDYTGKWGAAGGPDNGLYPRYMPVNDLTGQDTVW
jgi:hypothetical protein